MGIWGITDFMNFYYLCFVFNANNNLQLYQDDYLFAKVHTANVYWEIVRSFSLFGLCQFWHKYIKTNSIQFIWAKSARYMYLWKIWYYGTSTRYMEQLVIKLMVADLKDLQITYGCSQNLWFLGRWLITFVVIIWVPQCQESAICHKTVFVMISLLKMHNVIL